MKCDRNIRQKIILETVLAVQDRTVTLYAVIAVDKYESFNPYPTNVENRVSS